ncbi:MAG: S9 family peptidase [Bacteroidales bacterium]|nr:S9 family peptidase [Bacteroidales bacterium]
MKTRFFLTILLSGLIALSCSKKEKIPDLIVMEDFFRNPEKSGFGISPNGKYISLMSPWESRMNLFVQKLGEDSLTQVTFEKDRDIAGYLWANDNRLLFLKDEGGNEDYKLFGVNIDGSEFKCLTCFDGVRTMIIDELRDIPNEIIVGLNKRDARVFDPYRLDIVTGELTLLAENPGNIDSWITDHDGRLRVAIAMLADGNQEILYRDSEELPFTAILNLSWKDSFFPFFFTFDNKMLYAASNLGRDKMEIVVFDPKSQTETEVLFKNSEVDVTGLNYSRKRKVLTSADYTTDKRMKFFFDEETKTIYEDLQGQLPGYEVAISDLNKDEDKLIVRTYSDKSRGSYYFYDCSTKKLDKIAEISPWLKEENMADMEPVKYTSRDGLTIHGYLTLPKGRKPTNLPVVINPHGGPWYRDTWGFNPEVQFLANRGYAVLQMNFRGSTGYGKEFWLKSVKQWGRDMQNDITDGVNWLISEKIANKDKVAIYGGSYGGYATLAGLAFTPDLYACGVDYVGVSNMFTFMNTIPPYWEPWRPMLYELVGHPVKDSLLLAEVSPVFHAEKITAPLFIAQGANDPRVNKAESDQMVEALRNRGIDVEYMVKDNEGHGFHNEENRFDFYRAMEKFLAKYIGDSIISQ